MCARTRYTGFKHWYATAQATHCFGNLTRCVLCATIAQRRLPDELIFLDALRRRDMSRSYCRLSMQTPCSA